MAACGPRHCSGAMDATGGGVAACVALADPRGETMEAAALRQSYVAMGTADGGAAACVALADPCGDAMGAAALRQSYVAMGTAGGGAAACVALADPCGDAMEAAALRESSAVVGGATLCKPGRAVTQSPRGEASTAVDAAAVGRGASMSRVGTARAGNVAWEGSELGPAPVDCNARGNAPGDAHESDCAAAVEGARTNRSASAVGVGRSSARRGAWAVRSNGGSLDRYVHGTCAAMLARAELAAQDGAVHGASLRSAVASEGRCLGAQAIACCCCRPRSQPRGGSTRPRPLAAPPPDSRLSTTLEAEGVGSSRTSMAACRQALCVC